MRYLFVAAALAYSIGAGAQEYQFRSKLDRFTVSVDGSKATLKGKTVSLKPLEGVTTLFSVELADKCDLGNLKNPDLTITRISQNQKSLRSVFIDRRVVSDENDHCGTLSGQGLYTLPFHSKWFETDTPVTIALRDRFSIWKDDKKVVEFEIVDGKYKNTDPEFLTNWEFFDHFTFALKDIPIHFRAHPEAARDFSGFELRDDNRTFKFVKVGEKTWAVQFPDIPWLAASGQFGVFADMKPETWVSPYHKQLKILKDRTANKDGRIKAARAIIDRWVPDVWEVFYEVLHRSGDDIEVRKGLILLLKQKPTDGNFKALLELLEKEQNQELLHQATKVLRIKNPKGPIIGLDDDDTVVGEKVEQWLQWSRSSI